MENGDWRVDLRLHFGHDYTMEELGMQLINRGQEIKGLNKPERQKRLIRLLGEETEVVAPVEEERYGSRESVLGMTNGRVSSPVQSVVRDEDFELHKLRLQVELEAKKMSVEETKLRIEMEAREKDYDRKARLEMEEKRFRLEEADKKLDLNWRRLSGKFVSNWTRKKRQLAWNWTRRKGQLAWNWKRRKGQLAWR